MMIENKLLTDEFVRDCNQTECIRGIVCVDDVKAVFHRDVKAQGKTAGGKVNILAHVSCEGLRFEPDLLQPGGIRARSFLEQNQSGQAIDLNTVDDLAWRLTRARERNHGDGIAGSHENLTLIPDPRVGRKLVFDKH